METFGLLNLLKNLLSSPPEEKKQEDNSTSKDNEKFTEENKNPEKKKDLEADEDNSIVAFSSFIEKHERISRNIDLHQK